MPRMLLLALMLVAAACAKSKTTSTVSSPSPTEAMAGGGMMKLPDYAKSYKTTFTSPADGTNVTGNSLAVKVDVTGFGLRCDLAGKRDEAGTGHYHILLDKVLVNMYCTPNATVSMQNVKPGPHTLEVLPALNQHDEVMEGAQTIKFDYAPTAPLKTITGETSEGKPSIRILSPKPGDTVSGDFDVKVQITNFESNCDLFGKLGVAGYGHWHLNLDTTTGAMMGMAGKNGMGGMMGMACGTTFKASTAGLKPGETHSLIALLVENAHNPLMPAVEDKVDVKIG